MNKSNYDDDDDDGTKMFTSKNLEAERKRRERLSSRLLVLRSLMNKETIIDDAITYVKKLKDEVDGLSQELYQMEATLEEIAEPTIDEIYAAEDMKKWGIQEEFQVKEIKGNKNKLWVKMIIEKKRGRFEKLMEIINNSNIEMTDINVTTIKGAYLITSYIKDMDGQQLEVHQIKQLLSGFIKVI